VIFIIFTYVISTHIQKLAPPVALRLRLAVDLQMARKGTKVGQYFYQSLQLFV
jgi:hypothetical protein